MSTLGRMLHVWSAARHESAITAERDLRAPLPVVRKVGFASLNGGTGCSTAARGVAATLSWRRSGDVLLTDRSGALPAIPDATAAGAVQRPELTLTDWGATDAARLSSVAGSSHVLCLTMTTERSAVQQALDAASFIADSGTPTVLIASAVRGRASAATKRMLASSPIPIFLLPFDRTVRRSETGAGSSASMFALAALGAEIVRRCARANAEVAAA